MGSLNELAMLATPLIRCWFTSFPITLLNPPAIAKPSEHEPKGVVTTGVIKAILPVLEVAASAYAIVVCWRSLTLLACNDEVGYP